MLVWYCKGHGRGAWEGAMVGGHMVGAHMVGGHMVGNHGRWATLDGATIMGSHLVVRYIINIRNVEKTKCLN